MRAVLTGIDTHPARGLAVMLRSIGFEVFMLSDDALDRLKSRGYTGGVRHKLLMDMGYVPADIPWVDESALETCDLFVDIKVDECDTLMPLYPRLKGRTMIFLINGGWDDYEDYGLYYPTVTNNFWVKGNAFLTWMPFDNIHNLQPRETPEKFHAPIGLLHNAYNWGFKGILDKVVERVGLRIYGSYRSPMGIIRNDKLSDLFKDALAFIHLKASDCPGYALYEAFASGVPVVVTELLIKRMRFQELYIDGVTCLTWGKTSFSQVDEKHLTEHLDATADHMVEEIAIACERLKNPELNRKIGMEGHRRWKELTTWTPGKTADFKRWIESWLCR